MPFEVPFSQQPFQEETPIEEKFPRAPLVQSNVGPSNEAVINELVEDVHYEEIVLRRSLNEFVTCLKAGAWDRAVALVTDYNQLGIGDYIDQIRLSDFTDGAYNVTPQVNATIVEKRQPRTREELAREVPVERIRAKLRDLRQLTDLIHRRYQQDATGSAAVQHLLRTYEDKAHAFFDQLQELSISSQSSSLSR